MILPRRRWLKLAGMGLSTIALPSWTNVAAIPQRLPADQKSIKLSSNENPYGPSPKAIEAMASQIALSNRYGWDAAAQLLEAIAAHHQINSESVLLGAGSTELLDLIGRYAALESGDLVLPDPVYDYWTVATIRLGLKNVRVPLSADKKTDLQKMLSSITPRTRLVYICNPNNPTGTMCSREELISFVGHVPKKTLVLVDEAYLDYTSDASLLTLVNDHPNLIVVKTFSKIYGLAGARIGYAVASAKLLREIEMLQSAPNAGVSAVSLAAALASLKDNQFVSECRIKNEEVKRYTMSELNKMKLSCIPSHTNFLYFSLKEYKQDYFPKLKSANIIGTKIYEESGQWTRITIGTPEEMQRFIRAIG